ncbi:hypothetical protein BaRGS_00009435, partial [Batillaria attramentaria]
LYDKEGICLPPVLSRNVAPLLDGDAKRFQDNYFWLNNGILEPICGYRHKELVVCTVRNSVPCYRSGKGDQLVQKHNKQAIKCKPKNCGQTCPSLSRFLRPIDGQAPAAAVMSHSRCYGCG